MKYSKFIILGCLIFLSQNAYSFSYGCGFNTVTRQGFCRTRLYSSEFGTFKQVAVRITSARGNYYNYGGSNWSVGRSDIQISYSVPYPRQSNTVAGSHCAQYYSNRYICRSSAYTRYF
jgi:hypothetical protein